MSGRKGRPARGATCRTPAIPPPHRDPLACPGSNHLAQIQYGEDGVPELVGIPCRQRACRRLHDNAARVIHWFRLVDGKRVDDEVIHRREPAASEGTPDARLR